MVILIMEKRKRLRKEVSRGGQEVFPEKGTEKGAEADPKNEKTDPEVVRGNPEVPDGGVLEVGLEAITDILEVGLEAMIEDREKDHLKGAEMK